MVDQHLKTADPSIYLGKSYKGKPSLDFVEQETAQRIDRNNIQSCALFDTSKILYVMLCVACICEVTHEIEEVRRRKLLYPFTSKKGWLSENYLINKFQL